MSLQVNPEAGTEGMGLANNEDPVATWLAIVEAGGAGVAIRKKKIYTQINKSTIQPPHPSAIVIVTMNRLKCLHTCLQV